MVFMFQDKGFFTCIPPTQGIFYMTLLPSGISKIGPPDIPSSPLEIPKFFPHPLEILSYPLEFLIPSVGGMNIF